MLSAAKSSSIFIIFGLSEISGVLSIVTVRCLLSRLGISSRFKRVIGILNSFSGGVFFATSVLNLLPEARESMEQALTHYSLDTEYPLTELLMCIGFFLILAIEHFAHSCCSLNVIQDQDGGKLAVTTSAENNVKCYNSSNVHSKPTDFGSVVFEKAGALPNGITSPHHRRTDENAILVRNDFEDSSFADDITYQTYGTVDASLDQTSVRPYAGVITRENTPQDHAIMFADSDQVIIRNNPQKVGIAIEQPKDKMRDAFEETNDSAPRTRLRGVVLMIALSLHMIFDGLALGLLQSDTKIWELLVALSLHKVLVFFTIGVQVLEILLSVKKSVVLVTIFALVSPLGILIGESIIDSGDAMTKDTTSAILQGIATGTFLFVTFFEILQRELGNGNHDIPKVIITIVGFALVAVVKILEQEHGH